MDKNNPIWCNRPQDGEEYCKDYDSLRELLVQEKLTNEELKTENAKLRYQIEVIIDNVILDDLNSDISHHITPAGELFLAELRAKDSK